MFPNGYNYRRKITLDSGQVAGSGSHIDFPVLFSDTTEDLAHTSSGGKVESIDGNDIRFELVENSISTGVYSGKSLNVDAKDGTPAGVFFKPDGTKLWFIGNASDRVYSYTLSTPWDIATASDDSISLNVSGQDVNPDGIYFSNDGMRLFVAGNGGNKIYRYTLSTPWDLSTASYDNNSVSVPINSFGFDFKPDGTKFYVVFLQASNKYILEYNLSTPWDLSTASSGSSTLLSLSNPEGVRFSANGKKLYILDSSDAKIYEYSTSTDWSASGVSYTGNSVGITAAAYGLFIHPELKYFYTSDANPPETINQYNVSTQKLAHEIDKYKGVAVAESLENVALNRSIRFSDNYTVGTPSMVTDGNTNTANYFAISSGTEDYIEVDLEDVYEIDSVHIWHYYVDSRSYNNCRTEVSVDGVTWTTVASPSSYAETSSGHMRNFTPINARYVRDYINGSSSNSGNHWVEIKVHATALVEVVPQLSAYIRIPSLSAIADTEVYMYYGKTEVSSDTYQGIERGVASTDLTAYLNQWGGSSNTGEVALTGSQFVNADGTIIDITPLNNGVAMAETEASSITGYMMYSEESVHSRFNASPPNNLQANHLVAVYYDGNAWHYDDNNDNFPTFMPVASDVLIADMVWGTPSGVESVSFLETKQPLSTPEENPTGVWSSDYVLRYSLNDLPSTIGEKRTEVLSNTIDAGFTATVTFQKTYTNPVVVAFLGTRYGGDPTTIRVTNVTSTGCTLYMEELDGSTHTSERAYIFVVEAGTSYLPSGHRIEAGILTTAKQHASASVTYDGDSISFGNPFPVAPALLHTVSSRNGGHGIASAAWDVTTTGAKLCQERSHFSAYDATEDISWIAIEPHATSYSQAGVVASGGNFGMPESPALIDYSPDFSENPSVVVSQNTVYGTNGSWIRAAGNYDSSGGSSGNIQVYAEESDSSGHGPENIGFWAVKEIGSDLIQGEPAIKDSTINDIYTLSRRRVNSTAETAKLLDGYVFDATDDDTTIPINGVKGFANNNMTYSMWVRPTSTRANTSQATSGTPGTSNQRYAIYPSNYGSDTGVGLSVGTNGISAFEHSNGHLPSPLVYNATIPNNVYTHLVLTVTNKLYRLYVNGSLVRTGLTSTKNLFLSSQIGGSGYGYYSGGLDEIRYLKTPRSADWIATEYSNQNSPGTFYNIGPEEIATFELESNSSLHNHSSDNVDLSVKYLLSVNNSLHEQYSEVLTLAEKSTLSPLDSSHGHVVDFLEIYELGVLSIDNATHIHNVDNIAITSKHNIAINPSAHTHTVDSVGILVKSYLEADNALHVQNTDNAALSQLGILGVQDAQHGHFAKDALILQKHNITSLSASHGLTSDLLELIEAKRLISNSSLHNLSSDLNSLLQNHILLSTDSTHGHESEDLVLSQEHNLQIHDSLHELISDFVVVNTYTLLNKPHDSKHSHISDQLVLTQKHIVNVNNPNHSLLSDELQRIINWDELKVFKGRYNRRYESEGTLIVVSPLNKGRYDRKYGGDGELQESQADSGLFVRRYFVKGKYK